MANSRPSLMTSVDDANASHLVQHGAMPQELTDMIICHLDTTADKETLASCTLVARSWLYTSRVCLFKHVCLTSPHQDPSTKFLVFISKHPHISKHIRELVIRGCKDMPTGDAFLSFNQLICILEALPDLQSLTLFRVELVPERVKEYDDEDYDLPLKHAPRRNFHLKELVLTRIRPPNMPIDALDLLGLFAQVDRLDISEYLFDTEDEEWLSASVIIKIFNSMPPPDLRVKTLKFKLMDSLPALFWLEYIRRSPSTECIETLDLHCDLEEDIRSCAALIREGASTLTRVALDFCRLGSEPSALLPGLMSFQSCGMLATIHLAADQRAMGQIVRVAMTLPPSVQHLTIEINEQDETIEDFASLADWASAETYWLACTKLKEVAFVASNFFAPETGFAPEIKAQICSSLPNLNAQSRLHFTTDGFHPDVDCWF